MNKINILISENKSLKSVFIIIFFLSAIAVRDCDYMVTTPAVTKLHSDYMVTTTMTM